MIPTSAHQKDFVTWGAFKQWVTSWGTSSREAGNVLVLLGVPAELSLLVCRAGSESANTGVNIPILCWFCWPEITRNHRCYRGKSLQKRNGHASAAPFLGKRFTLGHLGKPLLTSILWHKGYLTIVMCQHTCWKTYTLNAETAFVSVGT